MNDDGIDWTDDADASRHARPADRLVDPSGDRGGDVRVARCLVSNVDLGADGRQHGSVVLPGRPETLDRPRVPLTVLRRGSGPCLLMVGGADGERSGSLALHRLARELDPDTLAGTVVIVPEVPREAFDSLTGELLDGLVGTPAETSAAAPAIDGTVRTPSAPVTLLELVGAPPGFGFSPMVALASGGDAGIRERAEAAMIAFGAPESVRFGKGLAVPGTAANAAITSRVAHVVATPGGGVPTVEAIDVALAGCRNVLVADGVLDAPLALRSTRTLAIRSSEASVHAPTDGLLELRVRIGQNVHRGYPLALVVDPTRAGLEPLVVRVPRDGVVLGARTDARVRAGDCIAMIADETAL